MITWETKDKVTNAQEATEAIADLISSSNGINRILSNNLDEVEEFAKKWSVPFNKDLMSMTIKFLGDKRWNGNGARMPDLSDEEWLAALRTDPDWKDSVQECLEGVDLNDSDAVFDALEEIFYEYKYEMRDSYHCWQSSSEHC
jgi:hypothetical protein